MESSHHSCAGRRQARQSPRYMTKRYGYNTDLRIVVSALERVPGRYFSRWKSLKFLQLLHCEVGSNHPIHRTVGNDASLRGTGDQTSLHPRLRDICVALLYHIHSLETPPELEQSFKPSSNSNKNHLLKIMNRLLPRLSCGAHPRSAPRMSERPFFWSRR